MNVCMWGGFPTEYSFDVHRDQVDYWLNIHLVYEWVRWIADRIFIQCMQDSTGLLTGYSFGVCRGQEDYWPDIHSAYGIGQVDCWLNSHSVYAGIWWITDRIFSQCMNGSGGLLTEYSVGGCRGHADCWPNIHSVMQGSGGLLTEYSFGVCRGQADYQSDNH
jgi:hypothetical protein